MSSYKLKKWYPSLPKDWKVGMLVTKKDKDDMDSLIDDTKKFLDNTYE